MMRMSRRSRTPSTAFLALLLVGGCAASEEPAPGQDRAAELAGDQCDLLSADQVEALAGERLEDPTPVLLKDDQPACAWGDFGTEAQVSSMDAAAWATSLPRLVGEFRQRPGASTGGGRKLIEAADRIAAGEEVDAERACELHGLLLRTTRPDAAGEDTSIEAYPAGDDPVLISGQRCRSGTYTSILLVREDLTGSDRELDRVRVALDQAAR